MQGISASICTIVGHADLLSSPQAKKNSGGTVKLGEARRRRNFFEKVPPQKKEGAFISIVLDSAKIGHS